MACLLETRGLEKRFDAVTAASGINVRIHKKEVTGIIGTNGAGKTTFINMITGHLTPSSGTILYQGKDITGLPTRTITRLGICRSFQVPQLFLDLSVLDNIFIALSASEEQRFTFLRPVVTPSLTRKAMKILERFGIADDANKKVGTLAQGVRKFVDIAMATVGKPNILFLDEPTSGVSTDEKIKIMESLLIALRHDDTTVLFIEHDIEIIEKFARRVIVFYDGKILADGKKEDVLSKREVKEFVLGTEFPRSRGRKKC